MRNIELHEDNSLEKTSSQIWQYEPSDK